MTIVTSAPATKSSANAPLLFEGLTWREFKITEHLLDRPGYRLSFLDGVLEIQAMPSEPHETAKERLGALLELYLLAAGFNFTPTGSMTLESESGMVKREADKSYRLTEERKNPDLAIEIVVSSGGINKLEAYKRLGITEVWFWEDGVLELHHLCGEGDAMHYERITQSQVVPGLDLELLRRCITMVNHVEAIKTFQKGVQTA